MQGMHGMYECGKKRRRNRRRKQAAPARRPAAESPSGGRLRTLAIRGCTRARCAATNVQVPRATDPETPEVREIYYYLVRSQNECGSTLGSGPDGEPYRAIPCD